MRLEVLDIGRFNEWLTRDFDRAFNLVDGNYIPLAGPETSGGGRLPGPLLYFLLAIPLLVNYSYESIYIFNLFLNVTFLGGFYWVVNRYFGFRVAVIATILLSINLLHVDMVAFPINPVFMFPFTILFLGFLLEFTENKNKLFFPLMFLVVTLAIQIHYSAATYYLVPIIVTLFMRIRVSTRIILTTIGIITVCLLPYFFYKTSILEPEIKNTSGFFQFNVETVSQILRIPLVQNTIDRITFRTDAEPMFTSPPIYTTINFIFLNVSFYGLVLFLAFISFKGKAKDCRKEFSLLLLFYIPALTYEIITPIKSHTWYTYIFLAPTITISAVFLDALYKISSSNSRVLGILSSLIISLFLTYQTYASYYLFTVVKKNIKKNLELGNPGLYYKNLIPYKDFIRFMFKELQLSPEEYYKRVFFEEFSPYSSRLLRLSRENDSTSSIKIGKDKVQTCYFIPLNTIVKFSKKQERTKYRSGPPKNESLDDFLNDKSIDIDHSKTRFLVYKKGQITKVFKIFEYAPKAKQACYQNSSNIFFTSKDTRDLLVDSYELNKSGKSVAAKVLSIEQKYNSKSELESLEGSYLIYDLELKTPFNIKVTLNNTEAGYRLRTDLKLYSFVGDQKNLFNLKNLEIIVIKNQRPEVSSRQEEKFQVIPSGSWISKHTPRSVYTNKLTWFKEGMLDNNITLKRKSFRIKISWQTEFPFSNIPCCYSKKVNLYLPDQTRSQ